ncbi:glycoside hydrolase family 43 protein [Cellulomonas sp. ES6]|uniref:glycoside hydrolase family 43 protein n=1 Tax=Cellulomonas sp. ES6 TaxID=3039384 RepID=UPI0024B6801D|nr:glycoside hydrolase family 43 protein [Cellulomonas sp. ES6]WHP16235.1 family 43 glycosylhydrolase [Cellulomonas sp. ES6]
MTTVPNPLLPGCYPDPSVCRVGDDYYLVTSTFEYLPGLPVFHSRDLASWEQIGHVVDRPGQLDYTGLASSSGLYAPTIRHHDGRFWVICTLVDQAAATREPGRGNFLVTATDPAGPWSDPVWLDEDGIDPSILFDDDGRVWVHGTRPARQPEWHDQTEVWVRELDTETLRLTGPEHVVWSGAVRGAVWAEGPHLYRVGDGYYLLAAEGGTEFHHAVSVARADRVTGPYTGNRGNPVLTHRHLGRGSGVVGVGHADLLEAADGTWWAVALAMRTYGGYHYPLGRETFLVPVTWEDGWPVFAPGLGRVPDHVEVAGAGAWPPGVVQAAAPGPVPAGDLRWTAVRALPSEVATADGDAWLLPVRPAGLGDVEVPAFLGLRQQRTDLDLRVTLEADLAEGEEAGLAARQSERHHVRLSVGAAQPDGTRRAVLVRRADDDETELGSVTLTGPEGAPVTLLLRARGTQYALHAGIGDAEPVLVGHADARWLDSVTTGGFLGVWLGVHATSGGRPTTSVVRVREVLLDHPR